MRLKTLSSKAIAYDQIVRFLASINLTLFLLSVLIIQALCGAWVPQRNQVADDEILRRFGSDGVAFLTASGLSNVFQSPAFLIALGLLFVNLTCCTAVTMAPRIRGRLKKADFLTSDEIDRLKLTRRFRMTAGQSLVDFAVPLSARGFKVDQNGNRLVAQLGRWGWLAAPVTHLGLFVLLIGVLVSSLTSYGGTFDIHQGEAVKLSGRHAEKPVWGDVPDWTITLLSTRREDYPNGSPKQWYSNIAISEKGRNLDDGTLSVNQPLTYNDVSFYQSDWAIESVDLVLAGEPVNIPVKSMEGDQMGVFPLLPDLLLIVSVEKAEGPLKLYLKTAESQMPKLIAKLNPGQQHTLGKLCIKYGGTRVRTGLQFRYDPGQPLVYSAFILLFIGALFVVAPSMRIWVSVDSSDEQEVVAGANPGKFRHLVIKEFDNIEKIAESARCLEGQSIES